MCLGAEAILSIAEGCFRRDPGLPVADPLSVINMKVPKKVTSREVIRARAIGLIEGDVSQGLVAKKLNVTRTTINHW